MSKKKNLISNQRIRGYIHRDHERRENLSITAQEDMRHLSVDFVYILCFKVPCQLHVREVKELYLLEDVVQ
jgi:hypothetical protein